MNDFRIYKKSDSGTIKEFYLRQRAVNPEAIKNINEVVSRRLVERDTSKHYGSYSYDQFRIGSNPIQ